MDLSQQQALYINSKIEGLGIMAKKKTDNSLEELSFEQVMERLESIVSQLEEGDLALEKTVQLFEQGMSLAKAGMERLDEADRKVTILLENDGEIDEVPFDPKKD